MTGFIILGLAIAIVFALAFFRRTRNSRRSGDGSDTGAAWFMFGDSCNSDSGHHHSHHDSSHHGGFDGGGHDGGGHGGDCGGGGDGGGH